MSVIIYHNPRCSKSRATLEIIQNQGVEPKVVKYLENPPSETELTEILNALDMNPRQLMRRNEADYKENGFSNEDLSDTSLIQMMVQFPKVIERPIVVKGNKAKIGRPPESVLDIL